MNGTLRMRICRVMCGSSSCICILWIIRFIGSFCCKRSFPSLCTSEFSSLLVETSNEEIQKAVFSMAPLKALGLDGFQVSFFQTYWDIVGQSVCEFVRSNLNEMPLNLNLNKTLLVLIPKVKSPERITQFRPISLCSMI